MKSDQQQPACATPEQLVASAIVESVHADGCWLSVPVSTSCSGCSQQEHCSSGLLAKALPQRQQRLWLAGQHSLAVGQQVQISVTPQAVLRSAILVYVLPLLSFLAVLIATAGLGWLELAQLAASVSSTALMLLVVRKIEARRADQLQVRLLAAVGEIPVRQY